MSFKRLSHMLTFMFGTCIFIIIGLASSEHFAGALKLTLIASCLLFINLAISISYMNDAEK